MTFEELRRANVDERTRVCFHPLEEWNVLEWAGAVCGEAGELANVCKKMRRKGEDYEPSSAELAEAAKEIGDTVIYLDLLSARLGFPLADAVRSAFNEVSRRKGVEIFL